MREMTLKDIQNVSLDILKDIHDFCVENDIKYTLFGGTLIGAIRHKGHIPWDDDLDIAFTRPEYEKFVKTYQSKRGYKLFARERQGENVYISYARVCEMDKTFVDTSLWPWTDEEKGVWVDVFPLDGADDDIEKAKLFCIKNQKIWRKGCILRYLRTSYKKLRTSRLKIFWIICHIFFLHKYTKIWDTHIALCKTIPFENAKYYSQWAWPGWKMREYYLTSAFSDYQLVPFEDAEFYVMKGYDGALRAKYGDYMELPPIEERTQRHSGFKCYWKV